ncbi:MAG TPA: hypothetical protein VIM53_01845 [Candidatus Saccharimonadales bacterium]
MTEFLRHRLEQTPTRVRLAEQDGFRLRIAATRCEDTTLETEGATWEMDDSGLLTLKREAGCRIGSAMLAFGRGSGAELSSVEATGRNLKVALQDIAIGGLFVNRAITESLKTAKLSLESCTVGKLEAHLKGGSMHVQGTEIYDPQSMAILHDGCAFRTQETSPNQNLRVQWLPDCDASCEAFALAPQPLVAS